MWAQKFIDLLNKKTKRSKKDDKLLDLAIQEKKRQQEKLQRQEQERLT